MKQKNVLLSLLAIILIACAVIKPAVAYFTDNTEAAGAVPIQFQYKTEIEESFENWLKTVQIRNKLIYNEAGEQINFDSVWIRARAISGETYPLIENKNGNTDWEPRNFTEHGKTTKWWVYKHPVAPGAATSSIVFEITNIPKADAEDHMYTSFNVAVVYESTLVRYDSDGNTLDPDWTQVLDTSGNP